MLIAIAIALLTMASILGILGLAFYRLWQSPPTLTINLSGLQIPDSLKLTLTHQPSDVELKPAEEPIPEPIIDYIEQESEAHARDARKRRARMLKVETGSWDKAFNLLQREDNSLEF